MKLSRWLHPQRPVPRTFKVVLAHDGHPTHSWIFGEGERMTITDPLVASLVTSGYWSIEVRPA